MKWTLTLGELVILGSIMAFAIGAKVAIDDLKAAMVERPTWTQLEAATGVKRERWDEASDILRQYRGERRK